MNAAAPGFSLRPHVRVFEQAPLAERALAREIAELIGERRTAGRSTVLGLATGKTMVGVYAELVGLHREGKLSFAGVTTFNLDEYLGLAAGDPRTFAAYMRQHLFDAVDLDPAHAHVPEALSAARDPEAWSRDWERRIREAGGIDLQLLGVGGNGHLAFNEPGSPRDSRTRCVELHESTRRDAAAEFGGLAAVPERAITMGVATVLEARRLRVLAFGGSKASIVRRVVSGPIGPQIPATWVCGHPDLELLLDAAAAGELQDLARS